MPRAPREQASVHHPNDLSHYTHCLARLLAVGINMTICLLRCGRHNLGRSKWAGQNEIIKMFQDCVSQQPAEMRDENEALTAVWLYIYSWMMNSLDETAWNSLCGMGKRDDAERKRSGTVWIYITICFVVYDSSCFQRAEIKVFRTVNYSNSAQAALKLAFACIAGKCSLSVTGALNYQPHIIHLGAIFIELPST